MSHSQIWKNGELVTQEIGKICDRGFQNYCTKETSGNKYTHFNPRPYGPPSCGYYGYIRKPGMDRWILRGCDLSKCKITTKDGKTIRDCTPGKDNPELVCDTQGLCGEGRRGLGSTITSATGFDPYLLTCDNTAPGGLADPMADMDEYDNTDQDDPKTNYLRNGFIMDQCEGQLPKQEWAFRNTRQSPVCWHKFCDDRCHLKNNEPGNIGTNGNCNYSSVFYKDRLSNEIWSGWGKAKNGINASIEEWSNNYPDEPFSENSCGQYLVKWAKTCQWCLDKQQSGLPPPDSGNVCFEDSNCYGNKCLPMKEVNLKPPYQNIKNVGVCVGTYPLDCKICNAKLWDYVPGGWQAIVDPNHPKHELALLSYVPQTQKVSNTDKCSQPVIGDYGGGEFIKRNCKEVGEQVGSQTNFCDAGPYKVTNQIVPLPPYTIDNSGLLGCWPSQKWPNNTCSNVCTTCDDIEWSLTDPLAKKTFVWSDKTKNTKNLSKTLGCETVKKYIDWVDVYNQDVPDSTRIMCKRNPQLTGYGIYENNPDKPTQSNYHIAMNWVSGKADLSDYGGEADKEVYTEDEKKQHIIEAARCCLGLSPGYVGDGKGERLSRGECIAASTCPSSQFCKDLFKKIFANELATEFSEYNFANDYPKGMDPNGTSDQQKILDALADPSYYAKMYCELMSGGDKPEDNTLSTVGNCGYDKDVNTLCRKAMYNYAVTPVSVKVNESEKPNYLLESYKLPLRIFDKNIYDWCRSQERVLGDVLPNQWGVCDMLLGRTCQQLQVDGWINPASWDDSPITKVFADKDGNWVEQDSPQNTHTGLDGETISKTCGCFLLGAQCGMDNCSYFYCGSGLGGERGPDRVTYDSFGAESPNSELNRKVPLGPYGLYDIAPTWDTGISGDFTCVDGKGRSNCFTGCNYVNYYDICWNANPQERKIDVTRKTNQWDCHPQDEGNSCLTEGFGEENYTCFGFCPVGYVGFPNCGTEDWFREPIGVSPNETKYKKVSDPQALPYKQYPAWQNFYAYEKTISASGKNNVVNIPGWGRVVLDRKSRLCDSPSCSSPDSIKPYGIDKTQDLCGSSCNVKQEIVVGNQGNIVGSLVMSNDAANACGFFGNWNRTAFNSDDVGIRNEYISLMGSKICGTNSEKICYDSSNICVDVDTGDNCLVCGGNGSGNQTVPGKNHTCCTSDSLVPETGTKLCYAKNIYNTQDGDICENLTSPQECQTREDICEWGTTSRKDNNRILGIVGNQVSYVCQSTCPSGTQDLGELQTQKCGKLCSQLGEGECNSACDICRWYPQTTIGGITQPAICAAVCPQPTGKVGNNLVPPQKPPPTGAPTPTPTTSPPTKRPTWWKDPHNPLHSLSPGAQVAVWVVILLIVSGTVGGIVKYFVRR